MRICPDCLSNFKKSHKGKVERKKCGNWGCGKWPLHIYHNQTTRKCLVHHSQSLADGAARRAGICRGTPKWANRKEIKEIYTRCIIETARTGILHEVDHIIPLKGKLVSGLHVSSNLRVITATQNRAKSNNF